MSIGTRSHFSRTISPKRAVSVGAIALPRGSSYGAIAVPVMNAHAAIAVPFIPPTHGAIALPVTNSEVPYASVSCPNNNHDEIGNLPDSNRERICNDYLYSTDPVLLRHDAMEVAILGYATAARTLLRRAHELETIAVVPSLRAPFFNPRTNQYG